MKARIFRASACSQGLRWMTGSVLAATLLFGVAPAYSQDSTRSVSAEDRRHAQTAFDEGAAFYLQGNYARAIVEFRKGYQHVPDALFLYNIALAEAKLGQFERALATSHEAAKSLQGRAGVSNLALGQACHTVLTVRERAEAMAQANQRQAEAETTTEDAFGAGEQGDAPAPEQLAIAPAQVSRPGLGPLGWTGVVLAGAGAASLAGSGFIAMSLGPEWEAYEQAAAENDSLTYEERRAYIVSRQQTGQILLFAGAGALAVGSGLFVLDRLTGSKAGEDRPAPVKTLRLTPAVTGDAAHVEIGWSF